MRTSELFIGAQWQAPASYNLYDAALPFGGFKESGFGRELGQAGLELHTEVERVWVDLA